MLLYLASHRLKERIRMCRIEDLVGPHQRDQVLGLAQVDDVVGIAGQHVHSLDPVTAHFKFYHFVRLAGSRICSDPALLDQAVAGNHDEEFPLGIVPVLAFGDAGF